MNTPCEVTNCPARVQTADEYAATPAANADRTYLCRIKQVKDLLTEQGAICPTDKAPSPLIRARITKWLTRAWADVPRPHMAKLYPDSWLGVLVGRMRTLDGELFKRLVGMKLDAEPLPEEERVLRHSRRPGHKPATECPEMLSIPHDWNGEYTVEGDYCIEALQEYLAHAERNAEDAGKSVHGGPPVRTPGRQEVNPLHLAGVWSPCGQVGRDAQGVLARRH